MKPDLILDRTEACHALGISRQTLLSWIHKGKLKVWKRVGHGSNAALLFERKHIEMLVTQKQTVAEPIQQGEKSTMIRRMQLGLGVLLSLCLVSESYAVGASGFTTQLVGAKALGQGNAFVAEADDPSAVYFNPAGMTQLKGNQLSVGGAALLAFTTRSGDGVPDDQMKKQLSFLPNFYATASKPFGWDKIALGVGLNSPYGLTTDWAPTSSVRYVTTESAFEMVNVNPSVAMEVTSNLSVGVGADYVNLFNTVSQSQTNQALANGDASPDGTSKLSGHGSGWGYNAGVLFKPFEKHSFGASYRSQVKIPIKGSVELNNLSASTQADYNFASADYSADATSSFIMPASAIFGYTYRPTEQWTLLADYEWTQWNTFQNQDVAINETDASGGLTGAGRLGFLTGNGTNVSRTVRDWRNVSAIGGGANYKINEAWQVRGGYAYYQRTAPDETFSPDIPDAPIHLLTAGFSRAWDRIILDFAFNAYFYTNRNIENTVGNGVGASVNGTYKTFVPALALGLTYKFGN